MQHLEVSGAVRHIYMSVVRQIRVKMNIYDVSYDVMDWNRLSHDWIRWRAIVDALMDVREGWTYAGLLVD